MSASNWGICPKCYKARQEEYAGGLDQLAKDYGKISLGEYEARKRELTPPRHSSLRETLREDYEIYLIGPKLYIDYECSCSVCGLRYSFEDARDIL